MQMCGKSFNLPDAFKPFTSAFHFCFFENCVKFSNFHEMIIEKCPCFALKKSKKISNDQELIQSRVFPVGNNAARHSDDSSLDKRAQVYRVFLSFILLIKVFISCISWAS